MSVPEDLFRQTDDQPLPGGCTRCDAYRTLVVLSPGIDPLTVHHDDWCPVLRSREARTN